MAGPTTCTLAGIESLNYHLFLCTIDKLALALASHNHVWTSQEREMYEGSVRLLVKKVHDAIEESPSVVKSAPENTSEARFTTANMPSTAEA